MATASCAISRRLRSSPPLLCLPGTNLSKRSALGTQVGTGFPPTLSWGHAWFLWFGDRSGRAATPTMLTRLGPPRTGHPPPARAGHPLQAKDGGPRTPERLSNLQNTSVNSVKSLSSGFKKNYFQKSKRKLPLKRRRRASWRPSPTPRVSPSHWRTWGGQCLCGSWHPLPPLTTHEADYNVTVTAQMHSGQPGGCRHPPGPALGAGAPAAASPGQGRVGTQPHHSRMLEGRGSARM